MNDELAAGWARRDITPDVGIHMGGYWGRRSGATAIHDRLWVRAVVWRAGDAHAVLVSLDLVALAADRVERLRRAVGAAVPGTAPGAVLVACSHTHAGPLTIPFRGMGEVDPAYLDRVEAAAVAAVAAAAQDLAVARLAHARVPVQIGVNRRQARDGAVVIGRNPGGAVAAYAHVLTVDTDRGRAILFQHACHPVVLGNANHEISAEFPGAACAEVEARTGAFAVYLNGAAGDINPRTTGGTFADVDALGRELGAAVIEGAAAATPLGDGPAGAAPLAWCRRWVDLPLMPPPPALRAACERAVQTLKTALKTTGGPADVWAQRVPRAQLAWSTDLLRAARSASPPTTQAFELHGLRVGALTWLGLEGEIFVRYQLDLEGPPGGAPVVVVGYANGCIGYVPTRDEYARGGYEVDEAYKVYPSVLMIAPESEALIRQAAAEVLGALGAAT